MNVSRTTVDGLEGVRPGREAPPGAGRPTGGAASERSRHKGKKRKAVEQPRSYYGLPIIKKPVWEAREIAGYLFLGGLAGASSVVAFMAQLTGRPSLSRGAKLGAAGAITLSLGALVKDLGRPSRFLNMLRVFKPTSPMSVGTWLLSAYAPANVAAAASAVTGLVPGVGMAATAGAAVLGPAVAAYTGVLVSDTAVPAWHEAHRHMPWLFVSSAALAASGLGLCVAAGCETGPVRRLAVGASVADLVVEHQLEGSLPPEVAGAYHEGRPGRLLELSRLLAVTGAAGAVVGGGNAVARRLAGACLMAASACTRFGVFYAGVASSQDPMATVAPQRARAAP